MKIRKQQLSNKNVEQLLKTAYGYNDEQLCLEYDRLAAQPDDLLLKYPEDGAQRLLERVHNQENNHKVVVLKKRMKPLLLVAVLGAVVLATGIGASGKQRLEYWGRNVSETENSGIWNNTTNVLAVDSEEEAYQVIEEKLGVEALQLWYKPENMDFVEAEIIQGQARLEFTYHSQKLHLYGVLYDVENSLGIFTDREVFKTVYNKWLDQEIRIEKNIVGGEQMEYGARIEQEEAYYYLVGNIEEEEFCKMVEYLKIYE